MSAMMSPTAEELFKTLMRTRVMIWDHNIARLSRRSAPLHYLTIADVENMRKVIFKKIEVILETSGDNATFETQVKELKTKLYDDSAPLEELKNPKPAETEEDSNDDDDVLDTHSKGWLTSNLMPMLFKTPEGSEVGQ